MKLRDAVATWWLRNAEIRHGHLPPIGNVTVEPEASKISKALPYVAAALLGGGGIALAPAALEWLRDEPPVIAPGGADVFVPPIDESSGSLYQYLEDRNDHLPQ